MQGAGIKVALRRNTSFPVSLWDFCGNDVLRDSSRSWPCVLWVDLGLGMNSSRWVCSVDRAGLGMEGEVRICT